jgi:Sugar-transfer associated ATP-grasp
MLAQIEFPMWGGSNFSPVELALWIGIFVSLYLTIRRLVASSAGSRERHYWKLAIVALATISALQSADWFMDTWGFARSGDWQAIDFGLNGALAIIIAAAVYGSARLPKGERWIEASFLLFVAFQLFAIISKTHEGSGHQVVLTTDFAKLLCVEFYAVALVVMAHPRRVPAFAFGRAGENVGYNARAAYDGFHLFVKAKHPPVRAAFYPGIQQAVLLTAVGYMAVTSGRILKRATGKPVITQIREMITLWFHDGIDPPSYYQQELYRPERRGSARNYLTRFETKNGLFHILNTRTPSPYPRSEMNDKALFAKCCCKFKIPHPQLLLEIKCDRVTWFGAREELRIDLFCKQKSGMGASHTHAFGFLGGDRYADEKGRDISLDEIIARVRAEGHDYLVQPWLRNAASIADLAQDSLIAFRVVTMTNELGQAEVTLAMLRVISKLEPSWTDVPDGEYAAPIDLQTGVLGRFTGDHMSTSCLYYDTHLVTGAPIKGRKIKEWPAIRDVGLAAHRAFPHRVLVGWDIALTDAGPVVLEGNTNLDVMFLQRVHDQPASASRFGALLNHHLKLLRDGRLEVKETSREEADPRQATAARFRS